MFSKQDTDIVKGIAILMVIISHIGQAFGVGFINPLGPIGVFLFLFISGYGLTVSYVIKKNNFKGYIKKRFKKVYVPYILTVIMFVFWQIFQHVEITYVDLADYLLLIKLPQGSYWYLVLAFYWYFAFIVVIQLAPKGWKQASLLIFFSVVIILLRGFNRLYVWQLFSFPLGMCAARYQNMAQKILHRFQGIGGVKLLIAAAAIVFLKKSSYVETHELGIGDTCLQIALTLDMGIFILIQERLWGQVKWVKKVVGFIGMISYELYLAHALPLEYLNVDCNRMLQYMCVVCAAMIPLVLYNFLLQNKTLKRGFVNE